MFFRVFLFVGFFCVLLGFSSPALAGSGFSTQFDAYSACEARRAAASVNRPASYPPLICKLFAVAGDVTGQVVNLGHCASLKAESKVYVMGEGSWGDDWYGWCVPASCSVGDAPDGPGDHVYTGFVLTSGCKNSCGVTFKLSYAGKNTGDPDSLGYSVGHWENTGATCIANYEGTEGGVIPKPPVLTPAPKPCAGASVPSCWDPFRDQFCAQSESGEWSCVSRKDPPPGGCISGATGSVCVGKDGQPVPPPPDPPIAKDTPPGNTSNVTVNGGDTANNYTVNNYSGMSPGGSTSSTSGGSTSGGGGSNQSGSGNSGSAGTDANGKCSDGSVPTASGCSGTYRDDGCDTPPACYGDAVMCGQARELHAIKCNTAPASGGSSGGSDDPGSGDGIDGPAASSVSNSVDLGDGSGSLDSSGFGYSRMCPLQDMSFTVMGKTVTVAMADKCQYLDWVGYLVLAMAYLAAAKIIAGVK